MRFLLLALLIRFALMNLAKQGESGEEPQALRHDESLERSKVNQEKNAGSVRRSEISFLRTALRYGVGGSDEFEASFRRSGKEPKGSTKFEEVR